MFFYLRITPGFALAVELLRQPGLASHAVVMSGPLQKQGLVCEANGVAQRCGIRSGMTIAQARRYCADLVVLSAEPQRYQELWKRVGAILTTYTPLVQPLEIGQAVCDLSGCERHWPDEWQIAREIQLRVREATGITPCIGIGSNRLVADLVSRAPGSDGIGMVARGQERQFLAPLSVNLLPGIDSRMELAFQVLGLHTFGQLAALPSAAVRQRFGIAGEQLYSYACGIDSRPVSPPPPRPSVAARYQCEDGSFDEAIEALQRLAELCAAALQERGAAGKLLELTLEWCPHASIRLLPVRVCRPVAVSELETVPPSPTPLPLPQAPEQEALRLPSRIHSMLPQPARFSEHGSQNTSRELLPSARPPAVPAIPQHEAGTVTSVRLALRVSVTTSAMLFEHAQRLLLRHWPASPAPSRLQALSLEVGKFEAPAQLSFAEFGRLDQVGRLRGISIDRLQALMEQEHILNTRHGQEPFRHVVAMDPGNVLAERRFQWRDGLQWEAPDRGTTRALKRGKRRALPVSRKNA